MDRWRRTARQTPARGVGEPHLAGLGELRERGPDTPHSTASRPRRHRPSRDAAGSSVVHGHLRLPAAEGRLRGSRF